VEAIGAAAATAAAVGAMADEVEVESCGACRGIDRSSEENPGGLHCLAEAAIEVYPDDEDTEDSPMQELGATDSEAPG